MRRVAEEGARSGDDRMWLDPRVPRLGVFLRASDKNRRAATTNPRPPINACFGDADEDTVH